MIEQLTNYQIGIYGICLLELTAKKNDQVLRQRMGKVWPTDNTASKSHLQKPKAAHGRKSIRNGYIGKIYYISFFYK